MDDRNDLWANRQILWGWLFLIAMILLLLYLFFTLWRPRAISVPEGTSEPTTTTVAQGGEQPEMKATMLAEAEATLASASLRPVESAAEVMAAAQTVVAATAEVGDARPTAASDGAISTPVPGAVAEDEAPGLGWVDWVLGAIPGLTAIVTFVGLVVSSLMKWRSDLNSVSQAHTEFEREKLQFELQKQRHELDRVRRTMELEQQRLELELERERLTLAKLRGAPDRDDGHETGASDQVGLDTESDAGRGV